jgi:anti-sigma B factor antagonist
VVGYEVERVSADGEAGGTLNGVEDAAFSVEVIDVTDRVSVVTVHGQADLHTASELRQALNDAVDRGAASLVVDLGEATFIDSMTLGVLLGTVKRLRHVGGGLSIACPDPHIRRVFEITLLDRVFDLYPDRSSALEGVGA